MSVIERRRTETTIIRRKPGRGAGIEVEDLLELAQTCERERIPHDAPVEVHHPSQSSTIVQLVVRYERVLELEPPSELAER